MQINYYYYYFFIQLTTNRKEKKNNWAPSKIRLRLGAEVDVTRTIQNNYKNNFFLVQSNWTGTCAVTIRKKKR